MGLSKRSKKLLAILLPTLLIVVTLAITLPLVLTNKSKKNKQKLQDETLANVRHTWPWAKLREAAKAAAGGGLAEAVLTYSFICTGTPVGNGRDGAPLTLALQDHVDSSVTTADFKSDIRAAFAQWSAAAAAAVSGLTLTFRDLGQEDCDGEHIPVLSGYERDPRLGDIRIGMYEMVDGGGGGGTTLAYAYLPVSSGSSATTAGGEIVDDERGDILFNARVDWRPDDKLSSDSNGYSIEAVTIHEIGHSLGLGHATSSSCIMVPYMANSFVFHEKFPKGLAKSGCDVRALRAALLE